MKTIQEHIQILKNKIEKSRNNIIERFNGSIDDILKRGYKELAFTDTKKLEDDFMTNIYVRCGAIEKDGVMLNYFLFEDNIFILERSRDKEDDYLELAYFFQFVLYYKNTGDCIDGEEGKLPKSWNK